MDKQAIDILREAKGEVEATERAVRMHMACEECKGQGGNCYYPEDPCSTCGFNYADSFGVEEIVEAIMEKLDG